MITTVLDIQHANKLLGIDIPRYCHRALAAEFEEVNREQFEKFLEGVNFRRDLIGSIRQYRLVSPRYVMRIQMVNGITKEEIIDGNLVAFYVDARFFIEPTGRGVRHI